MACRRWSCASPRRRRLADHPRIAVTGIEAAIGARYTYDTIGWLTRRCPGVAFVWIMGADNLADFRPLAALARHRRAWCRSPSWPGPARITKGPLGKAARVLGALPACRKTRPAMLVRDAAARLGLPARAARRAPPRPRCGPMATGLRLETGKVRGPA